MFNIDELTYTPDSNPEWFARALFGASLIDRGIIRVITGIKHGVTLNLIGLENKILQADGRDCGWTPNQIFKLSEKEAYLKNYKINLEQCLDEFETTNLAQEMGPGARNEQMPAELEDRALWLLAINIANEIEVMIVSGNPDNDPNEFKGMQTILVESTEAIKIAGVTLTVDNVLGEIRKIYNAIPEEVLQGEERETLNALISYDVRRLMRDALADKENTGMYPQFMLEEGDTRNPRIFYNGLEFIPVKGIDRNTIIVFDSRNTWLLTDLMDDLDTVRMGYFAAPMDNKYWVDGKMRLGFAILFEDECIIYSPLVQNQTPNQNDLRVIPNSLVFDVEGGSKTFQIVTGDVNAEVTANASGSGFTIAQGATVGGLTEVTVTATDGTGSIPPRVGQVIVSINDTTRRATVTLNQRNDLKPLNPPEIIPGGGDVVEGGEPEA